VAGGRTQTWLVPGENPLDVPTRTFAAYEVACLDIIGKASGKPVCDVVGGRVRDLVPFSAYLFYKHGGGGGLGDDVREDEYGECLDPETIVQQCKEFIRKYGNLSDDDGCDATCGSCVDPATLASTWAAVQANIFDRACTACHGEQPTAGLDLRAPGSYAAIVDVPAAAAGLFKVRRGDHGQSLIWLKMAKSAIGGFDDVAGGAMPFGFPLPRASVEGFGTWIDAGAPPDGYVAGAEALLVPFNGAKSGASTQPATPVN
jgi:hypothetical protein